MVGELEGGGPYLRLSSSGDADSSSTISPAKVIKYGLEILFCSEDLYLFVYFIFCCYSVKDLFSSFSLPLVTCPVRFPSFFFVGILQEGAWTFTVFLPEAKDIKLFKPHPEL